MEKKPSNSVVVLLNHGPLNSLCEIHLISLSSFQDRSPVRRLSSLLGCHVSVVMASWLPAVVCQVFTSGTLHVMCAAPSSWLPAVVCQVFTSGTLHVMCAAPSSWLPAVVCQVFTSGPPHVMCAAPSSWLPAVLCHVYIRLH